MSRLSNCLHSSGNHTPVSDWSAKIAELELLSREMLEQARAGDWKRVAEWEAQRRGLIDNLFAQPLPPDMRSPLEAGIRKVLASDQALIALGREGMQELTGKLGGLTQGRRAQLAYNTHK